MNRIKCRVVKSMVKFTQSVNGLRTSTCRACFLPILLSFTSPIAQLKEAPQYHPHL